MNIKKDDTVLVIAGKDRGKRGRVRDVIAGKDRDKRGRARDVNPSNHKVIIEGINIVKKHTRGRMGARQAGVVEREAPMDVSKVMVVCPECSKGVRIGHTYLSNGQKVRQCRHCGSAFNSDVAEEKWGGRR